MENSDTQRALELPKHSPSRVSRFVQGRFHCEHISRRKQLLRIAGVLFTPTRFQRGRTGTPQLLNFFFFFFRFYVSGSSYYTTNAIAPIVKRNELKGTTRTRGELGLMVMDLGKWRKKKKRMERVRRLSKILEGC